MFELFRMGLSFQKKVIDAQAQQLDAMEHMFRAATSQARGQEAAGDAMQRVAEQQRTMMESWFAFWGVNR